MIQAFSASAAATAATMPGLSSWFTSRHSSSRCGFAGGPSRRATSIPSTRWGHSWPRGTSDELSTARASSSASAKRPCSSRSRDRTPSWYAVQLGVSRSSLMRSASATESSASSKRPCSTS